MKKIIESYADGITFANNNIYLDEVLGEDKLKTILPLFIKE